MRKETQRRQAPGHDVGFHADGTSRTTVATDSVSQTQSGSRPPRQAVVLIHGIGEQRPMETLRGFVDNVLGGSGPSFSYSKPDRMASSFELRRLQGHAIGRPSTDFYEYYWAHEMRGTKPSHVIRWLKAMFWRRPRDVPAVLRPTWYVTLGFLIIGIVIWILNGAEVTSPSGILGLTFALVAATVQGLLVNSIGDAARYLDPHPENVASRQVIRARGVELLRRLHEADRYDRVVVVGHSLGSVIAYDVLTFFWQEVGDRVMDPSAWPPDASQSALRTLEQVGPALDHSSAPGEIRRYQKRQRDLWIEQRELGNPWLVTDLITLGSPLAYAPMLLAKSIGRLRARQRDRELPTCPPQPSPNPKKECYSYKAGEYEVDGQRRRVRKLHHGAPFAPTRWTNVYVPIRYGFCGDLVGGPLRGVFGHGIRDIPLTKVPGRNLPLVSHTRYWRAYPTSDSLNVLKVALNLDSRGWLPSLASPSKSPRQAGKNADGGERVDADGHPSRSTIP